MVNHAIRRLDYLLTFIQNCSYIYPETYLIKNGRSVKAGNTDNLVQQDFICI